MAADDLLEESNGAQAGAAWSSGTISLSQTLARGSGRRRPRGTFFWEGSAGPCRAVGGGGAEAGFGSGDRDGVGVTELHVQSHLAVGDVAAGQRASSSFGREELQSLSGRPRQPDGAVLTDRTVAAAAPPVGPRPSLRSGSGVAPLKMIAAQLPP